MLLRCENLTVRYGAKTAVDRLSFGVEPGEVYGLLGPNGAGKTSAIRALTTILEADSGTAVIGGSPLTDPTAVRANIGVLPESTGYPGTQRAIEHLIFHGRLFGADKRAASERAEVLLNDVGLADHGADLIRTFSRGMRQRLGIARALVNEPRVVFLDEPTLGLDPAGKQEILDRLRATAAANGTAVVLCSHLLDEVERVCDRVAIMDDGKLVTSGTVAEVVSSASVIAGARLDIDPRDTSRVLATLNEHPDLRAVISPALPSRVDIDLRPGQTSIIDVAEVLGSHRLPFIALEARGARLSDAFLQLTTKDPGVITT